MKKQVLTMIAAVAVAASVFTGCKKDTSAIPGPTVTILTIGATNTNAVTVTPGTITPVALTITPSSGVTLKSINITYTLNNGNALPYLVFVNGTTGDSTFATAPASFAKALYLKSSSTSGDVYAYTITAIDANGNSGSGTFTITSKGVTTVTYGAVNPYSAVLLGAQSASAGSAFASSTGTVYTQTNANSNSGLIDFVYYYGSSNLATLAAPNDPSVNGSASNSTNLTKGYTTFNATKFMATSITSAQFTAVGNDSLITSVVTTAAATASLETNLASGSIYGFITAAGKKGLVRIGTINTGTAGSMTIDVKVQQ